MTPKEKARELVNKYYIHSLKGKECAIIAVDEILDSGLFMFLEDERYWQEVKEEINKR